MLNYLMRGSLKANEKSFLMRDEFLISSSYPVIHRISSLLQ
jgi:hypothetical protein